MRRFTSADVKRVLAIVAIMAIIMLAVIVLAVDGRELVRPPRITLPHYPYYGCEGPTPTLAQEPIVVLEVYRVDWPKQSITDETLKKAVKAYGQGTSVVSYPDSYVPILIPKSEYQRIRKLLGWSRIIRITPFE